MSRSPAITQGQSEKANSGWFGGCNTIRNPWILDDSMYALGVNVVNRGGVIQTRPGYKMALTLPPGNLQGFAIMVVNKQDAQGITFENGAQFLIAAVSGKVYAIPFPLVQPKKLTDWSQYRLGNLQFNAEAKRVYFCIANKSVTVQGGNLQLQKTYSVLMMQDGITAAAYWDGDQNLHLNESQPDYQTPKGTWMAWSGNRLWVARDNVLIAGDLDDPLSFTERISGSTQGDFLLTDNITGLVNTVGYTFQQQLICFTQDMTYSFLSSVTNREQWSSTINFQTILYPSIGCVAGLSIVNHAGLLWWYAKGGLVSFNSATTAYLTSRVKYMDNEMVAWTSKMWDDLSGMCACSFMSYLLVSIPSNDVFNSKTMAMDYSIADELNSVAPPAWQGVWTGIRPVNWVTTLIESTGVIQAYCASVDYVLLNGSHNHIWLAFQDDRTDSFDYLNEDNSMITMRNPIYCAFETKLLGDGLDLKVFRYAITTLLEISGLVNLRVCYRGLHGAYQEILNKQFIAITDAWQSNNPEIIQELNNGTELVPQVRRVLTHVSQPQNQEQAQSVESINDVTIDRCFSLYLTWCGRMAVESVFLVMEPQPEKPTGECSPDEKTLNTVTIDGNSQAFNNGMLTTASPADGTAPEFNFNNNLFNRPFTPRYRDAYYSSIPSLIPPNLTEGECTVCLPCARENYPPVVLDPTKNDVPPYYGPVNYFPNQAQNFTLNCGPSYGSHSLEGSVGAGLFFAQTVADANQLAINYLQNLLSGQIVCMANQTVTQAVTQAVNIPVPATNATHWSSSNLPNGLSIDSSTGLITGTLVNQTQTSYGIIVTATNAYDSNSCTVTLNLTGSAPAVTSASITVAVSASVNYQIQATNNPTSYGATNLPSGLSIDTSTGIISGTIASTAQATYTIGISATNIFGTGSGSLQVTVRSPLKFTATNASSATGVLWNNFQISIDGGSYFQPTSGTDYQFLKSLQMRSSGSADGVVGNNDQIGLSLTPALGYSNTIAAGSSTSASVTFASGFADMDDTLGSLWSQTYYGPTSPANLSANVGSPLTINSQQVGDWQIGNSSHFTISMQSTINLQ